MSGEGPLKIGLATPVPILLYDVLCSVPQNLFRNLHNKLGYSSIKASRG